VLAAALGTGCLIPPPLELEGSDGGLNHRPKIEYDLTTPAVDQPKSIKQTAPGKTPAPVPFIVFLTDPDPQTLFLHVFINGSLRGYKIPIWSDQAPPTATGKRGFTVDFGGICDEPANFELGRHDLEFYFSDSGFLAEGERREPNPGGQVVSILWQLNCDPWAQSLDGGV
jgi:hypothetical protein